MLRPVLWSQTKPLPAVHKPPFCCTQNPLSSQDMKDAEEERKTPDTLVRKKKTKTNLLLNPLSSIYNRLYILIYTKKSRCFFKLNLHTIKSSSLFKNFVKKEAQLNYRMYDCFRNVVNPFLFLNFFLSPIFIPSIFFESSVRKLETGSLTTKRSSLSLIQIFF